MNKLTKKKKRKDGKTEGMREILGRIEECRELIKK